MQSLIAYLIVAAATAFAAWRLWRRWSNKDRSCHDCTYSDNTSCPHTNPAADRTACQDCPLRDNCR